MTVSTAVITVYTLCRGYTLYPHVVSPVSPEVANLLNTSEVSGEGFTTRPLQRNVK